jgi:V-type H+-transporting ATPase subunit E
VQAKEVTVRCRQADVAVCQAAIGEVERSWGALVPGGGSCPAMLLDAVTFLPPGQGEGKTCSGGVAVLAEGGRIVCNNTLDARLKSAFDANLPLVRAELFK